MTAIWTDEKLKALALEVGLTEPEADDFIAAASPRQRQTLYLHQNDNFVKKVVREGLLMLLRAYRQKS